jgi:hypothetical protein
MNEKISFKNVKLREDCHAQIKAISIETGINVSKLIEIIARKVIEEYKAGHMESVIMAHKQMRRDGTMTRT